MGAKRWKLGRARRRRCTSCMRGARAEWRATMSAEVSESVSARRRQLSAEGMPPPKVAKLPKIATNSRALIGSWSSGPVTPWRCHMFLCFCELWNSWRLHPCLAPYPQAHRASQLRSLRRAPGRLDHRPVQINRFWLAPCQRWCRTCDSPTHYWDFSSNRRELALGADAGCLVLSWHHSKSTPCLLVRHKYRHTNHHHAAAAASLWFKVAPAPLGVAHDTNATRPTTRTTAPPCPSHTRRTCGTGRAGAYEAGFVFRVVVVASSSVIGEARGPWGVMELLEMKHTATNRKRSAPSRNATKGDPKSSASGLFGTCLVAFFSLRCDRWPARWAWAFSCLFGVFQYDLRLGY